MSRSDLNFALWLRLNTHELVGSDKIAYNEKVYTEEQLYAYYNTLKLTEVDVFGYNSKFTIHLRRETFYTLEEAIEYVAVQVIDTATVIGIRHKNYIEGRDIHLENPQYKPQNEIDTTRAKQYLKK